MERVEQRAELTLPGTALVLATAAAASFGVGDAVGFLSDAAEDVFIATRVLGWVLLVWATLIGGGSAVMLGIRWFSRQPVPLVESALVALSLAVITLVMVTHPLWGSGSGAGG